MGLILTSVNSVSSTFKDQYKEFFSCDALDRTTLAKQGQKKIRGTFGFKDASDNVISNGSKIAVADGQCMIIVEQGQIVDLCATPGEYIYDTSLEPSIFTGNLNESVKAMFQEMGNRFSYGGIASKDQRVYYFNTKEIPSLKYGTPVAIPFRVVDQNVGLDVDIAIKCFGEYSIKIIDPILFYTNVCGNFSGSYSINELEGQLKSELLTALQPAFAKLSEMGIRYSTIVSHTNELAEQLNQELSNKWRKLRGIEIVSFGINSLKADEKDEEMIKQAQRNAMYLDPKMAAATLVGAQSQAMMDAAKNPNGAVSGMMGFNMASQAGGIDANKLYEQNPSNQTTTNSSWTCPSCGMSNTGNFCSQCGHEKPQDKWTCKNCGSVNTGNFCSQCGSKKPF